MNAQAGSASFNYACPDHASWSGISRAIFQGSLSSRCCSVSQLSRINGWVVPCTRWFATSHTRSCRSRGQLGDFVS
jgi:hypothetical protein